MLASAARADIARYVFQSDQAFLDAAQPEKNGAFSTSFAINKGQEYWMKFPPLEWKTAPRQVVFELPASGDKLPNTMELYFVPSASWHPLQLTPKTEPTLTTPVAAVETPGDRGVVVRADITPQVLALGPGKAFSLVMKARGGKPKYFMVRWPGEWSPRSPHLKMVFSGEESGYLVRPRRGTDTGTLLLEAEGFRADGFLSGRHTDPANDYSNQMAMGTIIGGSSLFKRIELATAGHYRLGVRYVGGLKHGTPFTVSVQQGAATPIKADMGEEGGTGKLLWEWTEGDLQPGAAEVTIQSSEENNENSTNLIVDAVLLTGDEKYQPDLAEFHRPLFVRLTRRADDAEATHFGVGYARPLYTPTIWLAKGEAPVGKRPGAEAYLQPGESSNWVNISLALNERGYNQIWLEAFKADGAPATAIHADVEVATAPAASAVFKKFEIKGDVPRIGMLLWPGWMTEENLDAPLYSVQDLIDQKLSFLKSLPAAHRPQKITTLTQFQPQPRVNLTTEQYKQELEILSLVGLNGLRNPPDKMCVDAGFTKNNENDVVRVLKDSLALPDLAKQESIYQAWSKTQTERGLIKYIETIDLGDEMYSSSIKLLNETALGQFRAYLQEKKYTPAMFGLASLDDVKLLEPKEADTNPLLFYVGTNFRHQTTTNYCITMTKLLHKYFPYSRTQSNHAWDGAWTSAQGTSLAGIGPKYWDLYKQGGLEQALCEDWAGYQFSPQLGGFLMDMMRTATRGTKAMRGCYVIALPGHEMQAPYAAYSEVAHGSKQVWWYNYGPDYQGGSDYWLPTFKPERFRYWREVNDDIGRADDILGDAELRTADVGILWPWSTDVWDWVSADQTPGWERTALWLALQHAQIPSEIVTEDDVAADYLKTKKVIYLTGTHLRDDVARKLVEWVKAGGTLYLGPGDATRNYLNKPLDTLDKALGFSRDEYETKNRINLGTQIGASQPLAKVNLEKGGLDALGYVQHFHAPSNAKVLAKFETGEPAAVDFPAGQGRVILSACLPGLSYARKARMAWDLQPEEERIDQIPPFWPDAERELLAYPARAGKARLDVVLSTPVVEATRLESAIGIVVPLINWTLKSIQNLTVRIPEVGKMSSVESLRHGKLTPRREGNDLVVSLPLNERDMLLLRR